MDPSDFPVSRSPRRELQGPRPPALKVRKDSYKISKKPPVAPQPQPHHRQHPPRPPVIIYTQSPKVIHTKACDFMDLVQRLTGAPPSSSSSSFSTSSSSFSTSHHHYLHDDHMINTGAISPAARYAAMEKAAKPPKFQEKKSSNYISNGDYEGFVEGIVETNQNQVIMDRSSGLFPGILSPGPASLPPISPNFFSPLSDQNPFGFFHDLSPVLHSNRNYMDNSFIIPSPSNFVSPHLNSPSFDIFNNFFDS